MHPVISIIVPIYKAEAYLPHCIDSILSQTYQNFEILLIDDGSPDNSGRICDEYSTKDTRIRVFHKENGGVTSARKLGIEKSNGEWIYLIDSDDYIDNKTLEYLIKSAAEFNSDLVIGDYRIVDANRKTLSTIHNKIISNDKKDIIESILLGDCNGILWGKLIKKHLFADMYFPSREINMGEDFICGLQLINKAKKTLLCDQITYNYVQQEKSITHSLNSKTVRYMPEFIKWVHKFITERYPMLNVASASFCLKQYYTYLANGGTYNKIDFNYVYNYKALSQIGFKLKILFISYAISPYIGNFIKNIILLKKTIQKFK